LLLTISVSTNCCPLGRTREDDDGHPQELLDEAVEVFVP
jgi:hypothetical protein